MEDAANGPARAPETVLGLDNVPLELPVAGAGSRSLAAFLDYVLVAVLVVLWGLACLGLAVWARGLGWWVFALFVLGLFLVEYGYFAGFEVLRGGQTFGKWALDLRVVTREGARAGTGALLVRNAVRTVDLLVGIPLMVTDPLARRLGDRLAGTLVVHVHPGTPEVVLRRTPLGWDAQETTLLETFLRRAGDMEAPRAQALAETLLECMVRDDPVLGSVVDRALPPVEALRRALDTPP